MRLNVVRAGSGAPLVLIHGLGGSVANWEPVIELLSEEREVIAIDLPGFGASEALSPGADYSAAGMGAAVAAQLDELGVERPHLAGNSLGAWVALEMAADGVGASVCGISPAGLWRKPLGPRANPLRERGRQLRPLVMAMLGTRRGRMAMLRASVAHPERLTADEARRWVGAWLDAPGYEPADRMMRTLTFDRAHEVRVPVTIAWGERDRTVGPPRAERMPEGTRYLAVPGWGHTPTRDDPEGVAGLLLEASAAVAAAN